MIAIAIHRVVLWCQVGNALARLEASRLCPSAAGVSLQPLPFIRLPGIADDRKINVAGRRSHHHEPLHSCRAAHPEISTTDAGIIRERVVSSTVSNNSRVGREERSVRRANSRWSCCSAAHLRGINSLEFLP